MLKSLWLFFFILFSVKIYALIPDANNIGLWQFTSDATDSSGNAFNGTAVGGISFGGAGVGPGSNSKWVKLPSGWGTAFSGLTNWSIELYYTAPASLTHSNVMLGFDTVTQTTLQLATNGTITWTNQNVSFATAAGAYPIGDQKEHQIKIGFDSINFHIKVDCVEVFTVTANVTVGTIANRFVCTYNGVINNLFTEGTLRQLVIEKAYSTACPLIPVPNSTRAMKIRLVQSMRLH